MHTLELGLHTMFVGQVLDVKCEEDFLLDGKQPDPEKIRPFSYIPVMRRYFGLGEHLGESYRLGQKWGKWA